MNGNLVKEIDKEYLYEINLTDSGLRVCMKVPRENEADIFETDIEKLKNVKLYNKNILVTENLQSVYKRCMVPDFLKFCEINIFSDDLDLNIARNNVLEEQALRFTSLI